MRDVSEESLLDYFHSSGGNSGRVKNADLLRTFKPFIGHSDPQLRAKYREEFKLIIDRIAVVKSENGEKYLILKKKYRHLLQERDARRDGPNGHHSGPAGTSTTAQWEETGGQTLAPSHKQQQEDPLLCGEPAAKNVRAAHVQRAPQARNQQNEDDEVDPESGSKSDSEHDEDSTGSVGSASVALDPSEKEWIYSAASARVQDLLKLLRLDPSLANKKDFTSTALHWAAKHGNEDMATLVADAGADINSKSGYTPLHIAALHGHQHILDLLIQTYGAKQNLRDYSGHLARYYLNMKEPEPSGDDSDLHFQVSQARERNKNRKLVSLFHSKKKWGSAEELAAIEEERTTTHQLALPAFRPRKFSR